MKDARKQRALPVGPFDLAVIGGGINGAAIARDAALRGRSVVLFEKGDLASGTSSASSKMIHGGIRYLERLRLGLVRESLRERHLLVRLAPHVVAPQPFVIPVYEGSRRGMRAIRLGLWLYDKLCFGRRLGRSGLLSANEVLERVPDLAQGGLLGGGIYWDGVMDDARLVVLNAVGAREAASAPPRRVPFFLRTYTEVVEERRTTPVELVVVDHLTGATQKVLAQRVVRAVGPWTDRDRLVPSKGIHLVLPRFPARDGLLLEHASDGRVFFVIPWRGLTVVGTTETRFEGSPDQVRAEASEVDYLLTELRRLFPGIRFTPQDVLGVYAGVRPLARSRNPLAGALPGARGLVTPGAVSRSHRIVEEGSGIYSVFGGKYTTFRVIAKEVVDTLFGSGGAATHRLPLPGGDEGPWEVFRSRLPAGLLDRHGEERLAKLFSRYGSRLLEVLSLCEEDPSLAEPVADGSVLRAEVVHAVRDEFVTYPDDFLSRRTQLRFSPDGGRAAYGVVEELIARHAPLPPPDLDARRARYLENRDFEDRLAGKLPAAT